MMLCHLCFCSERIISMRSRTTIQRQCVFRFLVSATLCNSLFVVLSPHVIMNSIATLKRSKGFDTVLFDILAFASRHPCSLYGNRGRLGLSWSQIEHFQLLLVRGADINEGSVICLARCCFGMLLSDCFNFFLSVLRS